MRNACSKILSAILVLGLAIMPVGAASVAFPLGVVVSASQAQVGQSAAINGSTVFAGDKLATNEAGNLQVRFGGTQARFLPGSLAIVNQSAAGASADILTGSVDLVSKPGEIFSLQANHAIVRPVASQAVVAQVTRVSASELLLTASRGALEVTYEGEVQMIPAGTRYRLLVDPDAADPQNTVGTIPAGVSKRRAIYIVAGAAAAVTGIAIAAVSSSSSSSPVSPSAP
jgi:hypothetical protein